MHAACLGFLTTTYLRHRPQFPTSLMFRHSPFRQHKTKDKHEIDRMTLTMVSAGPQWRRGRWGSPMEGARHMASPLPQPCRNPSFTPVGSPKPTPRPGEPGSHSSSAFLQAVELPDSFSPELRSLLEGLLQRDVNRRLGCLGRG